MACLIQIQQMRSTSAWTLARCNRFEWVNCKKDKVSASERVLFHPCQILYLMQPRGKRFELPKQTPRMPSTSLIAWLDVSSKLWSCECKEILLISWAEHQQTFLGILELPTRSWAKHFPIHQLLQLAPIP